MVRLARGLVIAVMLLGQGALGTSQETGELAKVKKRGTLVMLCFPHQDNPFISVNLDRGPMRRGGTAADFLGFDVEMVAGFADSLGVALVVQPVSKPGYDELIPDLLAGRGDLIASSFSIIPARQVHVTFSEPYFTVPQVVVARKGSSIKSAADLSGKRAATVRGSSQADLLLRLGVKEQDLVYSEFTRDSYAAVADGQVDVTLLDGTSVQRVVKEYPNLEIATTVGNGSSYGVAFRRGSDLIPSFNAYLALLRKSGKLEALSAKWVER